MASSSMGCWSCGAALDAAAAPARCPACQHVQPVHPQASPFALLGLPERFALSADEVEQAWLRQARAVHPDRFARASDVERKHAASQTAALNDAHQLVRDPIARAVALLRRRGASGEGAPGQDFLVDMIDAREDALTSPAAKTRVAQAARARYDETLAAVARGFDDAVEPGAIAAQVSQLRYLARLLDELGQAPPFVAVHR